MHGERQKLEEIIKKGQYTVHTETSQSTTIVDAVQ